MFSLNFAKKCNVSWFMWPRLILKTAYCNQKMKDKFCITDHSGDTGLFVKLFNVIKKQKSVLIYLL